MLVLTNVRKTFDREAINEKRALNGIDLSLRDGDFTIVIEDNGAGKPTVLNMVAGVCPIDSEKVEIDGINIPRQPKYRRAKYIRCMFQDPMKGMATGMEIRENMVLTFRRGQRRDLGWRIRANEKDYYKDMLARLSLRLQTRMTSKVGLLSSRQRQALTLLMATLQKPRLLLLDEHTAALSPRIVKKVLDLTNEMVTEQKLIALMITHNTKDAIQVGNHLTVMDDGHVIYDISGKAKRNLTVDDLFKKFSEASEDEFADDRVMLSK